MFYVFEMKLNTKHRFSNEKRSAGDECLVTARINRKYVVDYFHTILQRHLAEKGKIFIVDKIGIQANNKPNKVQQKVLRKFRH